MEEKMTFEEYRNKVVHPKDKPRNFKVTDSWGIYDAYKLIRKNKWYNIGRPLKEKEFYTIIRKANQLFANAVSLGETFWFPVRMGKLELRKIPKGVYFFNGKLKNTYPINWNDTLKLWFVDEEAREKKILIRHEEEYVYHIKYSKYDANYENRSFYEFALNAFIRIALRKNIQEGKIESLWLSKI